MVLCSNIVPINIPILDATVPISLFWTLFPCHPIARYQYRILHNRYKQGIEQYSIGAVLYTIKKSIQIWYCLIPPAEAWYRGHWIVNGDLLRRLWLGTEQYRICIVIQYTVQIWYKHGSVHYKPVQVQYWRRSHQRSIVYRSNNFDLKIFRSTIDFLLFLSH